LIFLFQLTCFGIKAAGKSAIGLLPADIKAMPVDDLSNCIEHLGSLRFDEVTKKEILSALVEKMGLKSEHLNTITLIELSNLVTVLPAVKGNSSSDSANSTDSLNLGSMDLTLPQSLDELAVLGELIKDTNTVRIGFHILTAYEIKILNIKTANPNCKKIVTIP